MLANIHKNQGEYSQIGKTCVTFCPVIRYYGIELFFREVKTMKIRFLEPGNLPYRRSFKNLYVYDKYIRTPSNGIITLATVLKRDYPDVLCYSESISKPVFDDIYSADIVFISIFTFSANRGYELADMIRANSGAVIVFGGLHATLNYSEAAEHCDYVIRGEGDEILPLFVKEIEQGRVPRLPGVVYKKDGETVSCGEPVPPTALDIVPDRSLMYNFRKMVWHNTIWPQVHASRGCPHNCDYCALVAAFGRKVRTRSPEDEEEDIKAAVEFFGHRMLNILWLTDDNFFADREWAVKTLNAIIESGIRYSFTIQARYEVGFDDEMLELLKKAGFDEIAMGIEFLDDESFENYHKKSSYSEILRSVKNIQAHGIRTRGLFIFGADDHVPGIGKRLADFVIGNNISGVLIQSMYFIPGTPVYETHKDKLIDNGDWSRCVGKTVHYPKNMTPAQLQREVITASRLIYSRKRLLEAIFRKRGTERILFIGEYFWQKEVRRDLKKELKYLESLS